ncbi:MAG TPA: DNA-binding transcriptional regulator OxyR [Ilumatobacteraceae bacterium]|nr:DNA-binding transcriptional regulator OxyR [Ilumatobacteraceae bacterium]
MNLQDLRYLVAVADHRHFGRAAESCFVSQPTLSTQIRKMEKELGVELIERSPRQVMLTETGERVVERARIILSEATTISEIARQAADPESGTLRIGLFPTLGPYLLPHVIPTIRAQFPKLELLLVEDKTERILAQVANGELDAALVALPIDDSKLVVDELFTEDFILAVPADHPLASHHPPVPQSVMSGEAMLLLEDGHCLRDQALSVCHLSGAGERLGFRATSLETLRQMVAAGVGATLLPRLAVEPPVADVQGIRLLPFIDPAPSRRIAMVWRPTSAARTLLPRVARLFADVPDNLVSPAG